MVKKQMKLLKPLIVLLIILIGIASTVNTVEATRTINQTTLRVVSGGAPLRPGNYAASGEIRRLAGGSNVNVTAININSHGNLWFRVGTASQWVYHGNLQMSGTIAMPTTSFVTARANAPVRRGVYATATVDRTLANNTAININGIRRNTHGNIWFRLTDGNWIYIGNVNFNRNITLTFNANGGSVSPGSRSIQSNTSVTAAQLPTPTRPGASGHQFVDWFNTSATSGGTRVRAGATFSANTTLWARWSDPTRHMPFWTRPANSGTTTINYRITGSPNATWRNRLISGATAWNNSAARVNFIENGTSPNTVSTTTGGFSYIFVGDRTGTRLNSFYIRLSQSEIRILAQDTRQTEAHVAQYIMAHEFGHAIGLRDNPQLSGSQRSVMTQGVVRPAVELIIQPFDVTGVNIIY